MRKNLAAPSPKSSPSCSAKPTARLRQAVAANSIEQAMTRCISRRAFLKSAAGGLAAALIAIPYDARAQAQLAGGIVPVEVNARPLTSFDLRDPSHVRFGSFEFRSGQLLP